MSKHLFLVSGFDKPGWQDVFDLMKPVNKQIELILFVKGGSQPSTEHESQM